MCTSNGIMENVHDEPSDADDLNIQKLLETIEGAEAAAIGVEQRLDRLLSNLDELLHGLGETDPELEQDTGRPSRTDGHREN